MCDVPGPVNEAFREWKAGGRQRAIWWSPKAWNRWLPQEKVLAGLQNPLGRGHVIGVFVQVEDAATARDAFVAAMVWGFGPVGYGAWRTSRILEANPGAADRLYRIIETTKVQGGPAGFEEMANEPLKYLGVAFGTKVLFFAAEASTRKDILAAPVLDRIVRAWLAENVKLSLDIWSWKNPQDYRVYCERLACWAEWVGTSSANLEEAIFEYAVRGPRAAEALPRRVSGLLEELVLIVDQAGLYENERDQASEHLRQLGELLDDRD